MMKFFVALIALALVGFAVAQTTTAVAAQPPTDICSSKVCGECTRNPNCTFVYQTPAPGATASAWTGCKVTVWAPYESASAFCAREGGTCVNAGGVCPNVVLAVPPVPVPTVAAIPDGDPCRAITACGTCVASSNVQTAKCGYCSGPGWGQCRATTVVGTTYSVAGPDFCANAAGAGHWIAPGATCVRPAGDVVTTVNSGQVTEGGIQTNLNKDGDAILTTRPVTVNVVTPASVTSDGHAKFSTIVDVGGSGTPTSDETTKVCAAIGRNTAPLLNVDPSTVKCTLTPHAGKKRQSGGYSADLIIAGNSGAASIAVSALLLVAAVAALF